jgi:hypothetical protein
MKSYVDFFGIDGVFENTNYTLNDAEKIIEWITIFEDKNILKPIIAVFPQYAKDMIINIVNVNTEINHLIAQHIIDTSNAEYKEMIKMVNQSVDNNKQENKFKNVSDDEIYAELKRRKANKSTK